MLLWIHKLRLSILSLTISALLYKAILSSKIFIPRMLRPWDASKILYVSEDIVSYIESHGFDDVRIDLDSQVLFLTPSDKKKDFEEYDRLQILLNGYKPEKVKYMGKKPYYFMETTLWKNKDKHDLIVPNKVIEVQINRKKIIYDSNIEKQIEELVAFFEPMRFTKSSQLSNYIAENQLGYKYPDLSGYLELTNGDDTWEFEGAIHPKYYA